MPADKIIMLSGDRPTGPLHLGHYAGSLISRINLQDNQDYERYIMVADVQALTDNFETPQKVRQNVVQLAMDYHAAGLDLEKSIFFIQSMVPAIAELTIFYMNLVTMARLERNPTVKTELQQKGYEDSIPAGFMCYPVSQAADITAFQATCVPVGDDQLPMIEQANEIVDKFNRLYNTDCLKRIKAQLSESSRLPGTDGKAKASKSLGNAIFLNDSSQDVRKKVFSMYTDPDHIKITDSGKIEGNVVFAYLDAFYQDKAEIEDLKSHYTRGGLGDTTIKEILYKSLEQILEPMRERRNFITERKALEILYEHNKRAAKKAQSTLDLVKAAMHINYFTSL